MIRYLYIIVIIIFLVGCDGIEKEKKRDEKTKNCINEGPNKLTYIVLYKGEKALIIDAKWIFSSEIKERYKQEYPKGSCFYKIKLKAFNETIWVTEKELK